MVDMTALESVIYKLVAGYHILVRNLIGEG
jgi:hypothetical protein